ncbi:unnamed protein product [Allacma fusca]|uniref:Transmembrane protein n=1 Tax=Allacma fusca TaxID=39272 RepID=A0A8J2JES8_9HEXA|nr:unnamed protein product [Allacma fusca]
MNYVNHCCVILSGGGPKIWIILYNKPKECMGLRFFIFLSHKLALAEVQDKLNIFAANKQIDRKYVCFVVVIWSFLILVVFRSRISSDFKVQKDVRIKT